MRGHARLQRTTLAHAGKRVGATMHDSLAADATLQSRFRERWRDVLN